MICSKSDLSSKQKTIDALKCGGVVILPTDTVYGFSGIVDAGFTTDSEIRKIKGRAETKPFIQLIAKPSDIKNYTDDVIPSSLLEYWPGPLTIIVKDNRNPTTTTAFRCPGDEWLRDIIDSCGCPIFSTSVNRSGQPVLTKQDEIVRKFESEVSLIVLDGNSKDSVPSTIVSVADGNVKVIRQGKIVL